LRHWWGINCPCRQEPPKCQGFAIFSGVSFRRFYTPAHHAEQAEIIGSSPGKIRVKHYSLRTEDAYVHWIKRFIFFHDKRHPKDMSAPEVEAFLSHLATQRNVAASTQSQALSAILFLYREVLGSNCPGWRT